MSKIHGPEKGTHTLYMRIHPSHLGTREHSIFWYAIVTPLEMENDYLTHSTRILFLALLAAQTVFEKNQIKKKNTARYLFGEKIVKVVFGHNIDRLTNDGHGHERFKNDWRHRVAFGSLFAM